MNKQEVIEKLKEYGAWCTECHDIHREKDRYVKVAKVRELLEQPDEPQKVKVPKFVAEWIEQAKKERQSLYEAMWNIESSTYYHKYDNATYQWMFEGALHDEHQELFVEAYMHGYEIEKEPRWKIINDDKYCLTSIEAGYGNSLHWAFDSTKKKPILFDNEETALYTAYITGGTVEKVWV